MSNIETPLYAYNLLGEVVYSNEQFNEITSIDVSDWNKGIYLIQVGTSTKKLIID